MASGGVRHQYAHRIGIQFTQESIAVYENFEAEFGVDPQFHQNGYLILQQTEEERTVYSRSAELQRSMGVDTRMLTPDEVRAGWPYLRTDDLVFGDLLAPGRLRRSLPRDHRDRRPGS
jgi:sarcosine oxidase subunit beta